MEYNFDEVVDRRNSDCVKWNSFEGKPIDEDVLPMWIADMDFKSSPKIIEALKARADHGVFGYMEVGDSVYDSIINWVRDRYGWEIKKEWIVFTPGVVAGFNLGIQALSKEGEEVIIQPPVYPPFYRVINNINRKLVTNPLIEVNEQYQIDFDDLEDKLKTSKLLLLCSPHNPVGRVWTEEELGRLSKLALDNGAYIISDEIHADFVFKGYQHKNIACQKDMADRTITLLAPSKTFNIAGLATSLAIIPNEEIRNTYAEILAISEMGGTTIFGIAGLEAAYSHGHDWLDKALDYIEANVDFAIEYIEKNIPRVKIIRPEGTYLLWLDFRDLGLSKDEIASLLLEKGKILLNDGSTYGSQGDRFFRFNIGAARSLVEEGLKRIEKAINSL